MKHLLTTFILLLLASMAIGQEIVVIGQVLSAHDATPLAAANVWFKGTNIGTTTNNDGFFILRSNEPQKLLTVSVVGYKKRTVKLDYGKDQMVEIALHENSSFLEEIVVMPNQDDALKLLDRVRKNRHVNDPEYATNIRLVKDRTMYANVANVKSQMLRRKLFKDLSSGAIAQTDTTYSLPIYALQQTETQTIMPDTASEIISCKTEKAINVLESNNWNQLLASYLPTVNPYRPYMTLLGSNFMSPIAKNARIYYNLYLSDSISTDYGKTYLLTFKPKRDEGLLLRGTMSIDSASAAITAITYSTASFAPVNFLNNYSYSMTSENVKTMFFPKTEKQFLDLQLIPNLPKQHHSLGTILSNNAYTKEIQLLSDTLTRIQPQIATDTLEDEKIKSIFSGIDSVNQSRIQRFASWVVDVALNQYFHIWKIDLGPILNLYHYNRYEGVSPRLSLRSGKSFAKHFSFGGYYGYGFNDHQHKYGGQIQWEFGRNKRHYLAFYYDHKVERYGYDDLHVVKQNRVHDIDHLLSVLSQLHQYPTLALHKRMNIEYRYEKPGFRFNTDVRTENIYGNSYMPYIQNGKALDKITVIGLKAGVRLSWKEKTLDQYFHRMYMKSAYPIVNITAEIGGFGADQNTGIYGRFNVYAHQTVPIGFGRLRWGVQGSAVVGNVPWPLLTMVRSSRGVYFHDTDFSLLGQLELMADLFVSASLNYQTRGYIFGYIPGIKRLGIRENLIFKIGYGGLREGHRHMLALPSMVQSWNKMPYIEAGVGLSNILYIGDIQFIWRLTHRNSPEGSNFGILWKFTFDH